ncbi:MAG: helix-turn-helix domain-containing protein [Candidatus Enteromonas sp.]|nr:helix-turn-helix domain-containing protein [Candidatus Enteromonas sp.]
MDFKETLLYVRAKLNLSQSELGDMMHVSYVTICRWECGKTEPTKKARFILKQICDENKIEIEEVKQK